MTDDIAIKVDNLTKVYHLYDKPQDRLKEALNPFKKSYHHDFYAVNDISFEIKKGETVGIIGKNGAGKSTLLKMITGVLTPTSGSIQVNGKIASLLELGAGFNPEMSGMENIYLNGTLMGFSKKEMDAKVDAILDFADIGEFIGQPVKVYSSGMFARLAFSVAINVEPDILIVDEVLSVGDAAFQRKCMRKLNDLNQKEVTLLFVSHDIEAVKKLCSEAIYLSQGTVCTAGQTKSVCIEYERNLFGADQNNKLSLELDGEDICESISPVLDPELITTNEEVYGDGRVIINGIMIRNKQGHQINLLEIGTDFTVSYRVSFVDYAAQAIFGMMITTREGICVFGVNTDGRASSRRDYELSDELNIIFHLTNNLGPGIYYLTCGVHSSDHPNGLIYLQRRMDTVIFKSVARADQVVSSGTSYLCPKIEEIAVTGRL